MSDGQPEAKKQRTSESTSPTTALSSQNVQHLDSHPTVEAVAQPESELPDSRLQTLVKGRPDPKPPEDQPNLTMNDGQPPAKKPKTSGSVHCPQFGRVPDNQPEQLDDLGSFANVHNVCPETSSSDNPSVHQQVNQPTDQLVHSPSHSEAYQFDHQAGPPTNQSVAQEINRPDHGTPSSHVLMSGQRIETQSQHTRPTPVPLQTPTGLIYTTARIPADLTLVGNHSGQLGPIVSHQLYQQAPSRSIFVPFSGYGTAYSTPFQTFGHQLSSVGQAPLLQTPIQMPGVLLTRQVFYGQSSTGQALLQVFLPEIPGATLSRHPGQVPPQRSLPEVPVVSPHP